MTRRRHHYTAFFRVLVLSSFRDLFESTRESTNTSLRVHFECRITKVRKDESTRISAELIHEAVFMRFVNLADKPPVPVQLLQRGYSG
jgi:hypothetical protein